MFRRIALLIGTVATALLVLPAPQASAGASLVFIGGPPFPFSLCAEFGTAPNNWLLTTQLSNSIFAQYASTDADKSSFNTAKKKGTVLDKVALVAESGSHAIIGTLTATYKDGGNGTVDFHETSPINVKYHLTGPATVDLTGNCSSI